MKNHIEILREDIGDRNKKFPNNPRAPRPPERDRSCHGKLLKSKLSGAIESINKKRIKAGIDPDKLLVLEMSSKAGMMAPDIRFLQDKLGLSIMEEVRSKSEVDSNVTKLLVQFNTKNDIENFEYERSLYERDSEKEEKLTYRQRAELFACIEDIRCVSKEDRTGKALLKAIDEDNLPDGLFLVDIDIWYDKNSTNKRDIESQIKQALGIGEGKLCGDLFELSSLLLGRISVNRFTLEAIRNLDIIALVDFPLGEVSTEQCELYSPEFVPLVEDELDDNAPLACVIDSGVFSGNPLLSSLIVAAEDFDLTENSTSDFNGHGTGVAGIVAYGDFHEFNKTNRVFKPLVRICNGKVMHNHDNRPEFHLGSDKRPEQMIKEAILYFYREYSCRVYNLSLGYGNRVYTGGRQKTLALLLDELIHELDIVIVVSAGNVLNLDIPHFNDRNDLMEKSRNQLLTENHRLIDPATTALGITVGSITRYEEPETIQRRPLRLSAGKKNYPSVFTRTGPGVNGAIKPEFVDYGGNYAVIKQFDQDKWWPDRALNEPTLNNTNDKSFKGWCGTSFSAPHVTHIAARLERALQSQIEEVPSSNLIRALLASSAKYYEKEWIEDAIPPGFTGSKKQKQNWRLRLCGYGKVHDSTLFTDRNHVTLFAEDKLELRRFHLYKIPVPTDFLNLRNNKRIAIGFAYNPPIRSTRKEYIGNSLWFEVFRRIDEKMLLQYMEGITNGEEKSKLDKYKADFKPKYKILRNSTLQQSVWEKSIRGGNDLLWDDNEPYIYVVITGKSNFNHPDESLPQSYALAITFSYDSEEEIHLRQKISERARIRLRERVRMRAQIQA